MNKLIILLLTLASTAFAQSTNSVATEATLTITLTLNSDQQKAYTNVLARELDANLAALKLPDYISALLMQSVVGVQIQEANASDGLLLQAIKSADQATKTATAQSLGVDTTKLVAQPVSATTVQAISPSPTPITVKPAQSP